LNFDWEIVLDGNSDCYIDRRREVDVQYELYSSTLTVEMILRFDFGSRYVYNRVTRSDSRGIEILSHPAGNSTLYETK
jgi:hypothetical protein